MKAFISFFFLFALSASVYAGPSEDALRDAVTGKTQFKSHKAKVEAIKEYLEKGVRKGFSRTPADPNGTGTALLLEALEKVIEAKVNEQKRQNGEHEEKRQNGENKEEKQNYEIVQLLLDHGAKPYLRDFSYVLKHEDYALANSLADARTKQGNALNGENLTDAISSRNVRVINFLCDKGVSFTREHILQVLKAQKPVVHVKTPRVNVVPGVVPGKKLLSGIKRNFTKSWQVFNDVGVQKMLATMLSEEELRDILTNIQKQSGLGTDEFIDRQLEQLKKPGVLYNLTSDARQMIQNYEKVLVNLDGSTFFKLGKYHDRNLSPRRRKVDRNAAINQCLDKLRLAAMGTGPAAACKSESPGNLREAVKKSVQNLNVLYEREEGEEQTEGVSHGRSDYR